VCQHVFDQIKSELSQTPGLFHHMLIAPFVPVSLNNLIEENGNISLIYRQIIDLSKLNCKFYT
jgi:hypothetical protein